MPVLIFPRDIEKNNKNNKSFHSEDILRYLSDVTIYLNSECNINCLDCEKYNNQFFHCTKSSVVSNIDFIFLKKFFNQLPPTLIRRIAITGGNIFLYPYFWELIDFLKKEDTFPLLGIHYENIDADKITLLSDFPIDLFVYFPLKEFFEKNIKYLSKNKKIKFIFIISSEECYKNSEYLISKHKIKNYVFNPFFTGKNLNFFKENVFLTTDDILSKPISQKIIFARQKLNTNFFGRIYLFPNGDVKSHPLQSVLGNCKNETLGKIIEKELVNNTSWRIIRDKTPCIDCIYQFLCPSPSEFEWAMNKNNLCKIFK